jgi:hypothetical protein
VTNKPLLWQLHLRSREWGQRPADLVGITDSHGSYAAWCFDGAVDYFGREVEEAMDKVKGKSDKGRQARRENVLRKMLGYKPKYQSFSAPNTGASADRPEPNFKME